MATASEPLTLTKEYSMQQTWRTDADKLTFISCMPLINTIQGPALATKSDTLDRMLGDVNLFLTDSDDEDSPGVVGEIELMIARRQHQGQGYGRASLLAFLKYISDHEQEIVQQYLRDKHSLRKDVAGTPARFTYFTVKIDQSNHRSIGLFETLGFVKVGQANYFGEVELRLAGDYRSASWRWYVEAGEYRELRYEEGE